jgi:DNA primase
LKILEVENVIEQLRPKLSKYLELHGVSSSRRFKCFNPAHTEDEPSASLNPKTGYTTGHCFGCGMSFDIFTAAHWIEGLPAEGSQWIMETIPELADQLKIRVEWTEPTEEEKDRIAVRRAYSDAARYVADPATGEWTEDVESYLAQHNWSKKLLADMGVGVGIEEEFAAHMSGLGYSMEYLQTAGLIPPGGNTHHIPRLIASNQLIFTIRDELGRPCAFAARRFEGNRKFVNSGSNDIYNKSQTLYNLDTAKKLCRQGRPLYIFEGYGDVISAILAGLENCVAMCGTALTIEHFETIKRAGITDVILCYDFDDAGVKNTKRVVEEIIPQVVDLNIRIIGQTSEEDNGKDPGTVFEEEGAEGLLNRFLFSTFGWLLREYLSATVDDTELVLVADRMVPIVASESNAIIRDAQIGELVRATGVQKYAIEVEVRKRTEEIVAEREHKRQAILERSQKDIQRSPTETIQILERTIGHLEDLDTQFNANRYSAASAIHMLDTQRSKEFEKAADDAPGFYLPYFKGHMMTLSDGSDWRFSHLKILGGEENVGKSSLLAFMLYNIACWEANEAICIYWSIDDAGVRILPKFACIANAEMNGFVPTKIEDPRLTIHNVVNPKRSVIGLPDLEARAMLQRREAAYDRLRQLTANDNLILKDSRSGNTLSYARGILRHYRNKYPSRPIVIVVDNTHNLNEFTGVSELREKYNRIATTMKDLCTIYDATMIASVEYRKKQRSIEPDEIWLPRNDDIKETGAFKYRADWIGHIYSDIKERPTKYFIFYTDPVTGEHMPRIGLFHAKTKINGYTGVKYMDFYPASSSFVEIADTTVSMEGEKFIEGKEE